VIARVRGCRDPRRHAPAYRDGRCDLCRPTTEGVALPLAWAIAVRYATGGRSAAVAFAIAEVRAGRASLEVAGCALSQVDPTMRTDLELAMQRRRR
jgi:hypothetical protein